MRENPRKIAPGGRGPRPGVDSADPMTAPRLTHPNAASPPPPGGPARDAPGTPDEPARAQPAGAKPIRLRPPADRMPRIEALGRRWAPHQDLYHEVLNRSWAQLFLLIM